MRKFISAVAVAAALVFAGSPAQAQPGFLDGRVYQVAPNGVYIQNNNGLAFVPSASASFRVGGVRVNLGALGVGAPVQAYYAPTYAPQYIPVEYYNSHPNWGWNQHWNSWQSDRRYWHQDRGRWWRDRNDYRPWDNRHHHRGHNRH